MKDHKYTLEQLYKLLEKHQAFYQKDVLNVEEAAHYMRVSKSTVYKLTSQRRLEHFCPSGKIIYFTREALDRYMLQNRVPTEEELSNQAIKEMADRFKD